MFDLYACPGIRLGDISRDATLIARYGNEKAEYYSGIAQSIKASTCHAELLVAKELWTEMNRHKN